MRTVAVNLEELDRIVDGGKQAPLSEADGEKLKTVLPALAPRAAPRSRSTEKTRDVLAPGHGRNGEAEFTGAQRIVTPHEHLRPGDRCPECQVGKVYPQQPHTRLRIVGQVPLQATVYEMERLRGNGCQEVFTATAPAESAGEKYDPSAAAMIALLRYGSGLPFHRLERLQAGAGLPRPAATQWDVAEAAAHTIWPVYDELIGPAAQGGVFHNDDTGLRILRLPRAPALQGQAARTGVFTSGIVAQVGVWTIALYFSGANHAGENLARVLKRRAPGLAPLSQMCDALSRHAPRLAEGVRLRLAYGLAHGRRQFVEVAENFPEQGRFVLETLGRVWHNDAVARERHLTPDERRRCHHQHSEPLMQTLHVWMEAQLAEHRTEPNSGLGKASQYRLRHGQPLTLFLREPHAPLDNNVVERAWKKAILHRKNSLFYQTVNGAAVGDLSMSLIHTCELNGVNPFDYLTELGRHAGELKQNPPAWLPWTYRPTLAQRTAPAAAA